MARCGELEGHTAQSVLSGAVRPKAFNVFHHGSSLLRACSSGCDERGLLFVAVRGCESWTIKKAKHQRIDAFELWYWRRLLKVP